MKFTTSDTIEIFIALLGLIGIISQSIITYSISKPPDQKTEKTNPIIISLNKKINKNPKKYKWGSLLLAFIFLAISLPGIITVYHKCFVQPYIKINYPMVNQRVPEIIDIKGKFRNIKNNEQSIWLTIYSYVDDKYFLHKKPADLDHIKKEWTNKNTIIGTSNDSGKKFNILVLLIDNNTNSYNEIQNYIHNINSHGLNRLPDGSQILKEISVFIE